MGREARRCEETQSLLDQAAKDLTDNPRSINELFNGPNSKYDFNYNTYKNDTFEICGQSQRLNAADFGNYIFAYAAAKAFGPLIADTLAFFGGHVTGFNHHLENIVGRALGNEVVPYPFIFDDPNHQRLMQEVIKKVFLDEHFGA